MCQFCVTHGEGEKWYLRAENYAEDLLSDLRRRRFVEGFLADSDHLRRDRDRLERLARAPGFVRRAVARGISWRMKKVHFGQVVPLEDLERILGFVSSVVRLACACRQVSLGREARYCYALSLAPDGGEFRRIADRLDPAYFKGPDMQGLETLTCEEALASFRGHEDEGLCHSVWTLLTPYIGVVCNCDRTDCMAMRSTVVHDVPVMFRAEYVARLDPDRCIGCRSCLRSCQFGALSYRAGVGKAGVDASRCFGCGVCRVACPTDALDLADRASDPVAARLW